MTPEEFEAIVKLLRVFIALLIVTFAFRLGRTFYELFFIN